MARRIEVQIVGNSAAFEKSLGRASSSASSFGSGISKLGKLALLGGAAIGTGFAVGVGKALNAAGNFEQSLNTLQAVSGATEGQMSKISSRAMALGNDLTLPATSAKDAADAMLELNKGGLSLNDTMAASKGVLQLAAAAQISNAEAATTTARALNAFNLSGTEAVRVADVLANAANASTGEVSDFALGLQQSAAVAHNWGLSINETTAALMELAQAGIVGSDAGTSLKTMLSRLIPSTKPAAAAMHDLGADVFDAHGKFVGIKAAIGQYHDGLAKLNPEQRKMALQTIFGSDAIRAANIIMGQGAGKFDQYVKTTERSGTAAEIAAAKMKGFKGGLAGLQSQVETMSISLGMKLLPTATSVISGLNNLLSQLGAAKTLHAKLNVLWDFGTSIADAFERAWSGTDMGTIASRNTSGAGFSQGIQGMIQSAFEGVDWTGVGVTIADGIAQGIGTAGDIAKKVVDVVNHAMDSINWEQVGRKAGPGLATAVLAAFATILDPGFWIRNWDLALAVGSVAFGGAIGKVAGKLAEPFAKIGITMFGKLATVLNRELPKIGPIIVVALAKLPGAAGAVIAKMGSVLEAGVRKLFGKLGGLAVFTIKVLGIDAAIKAIAGAATSIAGKVASWATAGVHLGKGVIDGIWNGIKAAWEKVSAFFHSRPGAIVAAFGNPAGILVGIGAAIIGGLLSGIESAWKKTAGFLSGLGGKIKSLKGPEAKDAVLLVDEGMAIIRGLQTGMDRQLQSGLMPFLGTIAPKIAKALANVNTSQTEAALARSAAAWTAFGAALTPIEAKLKALQDAETRRSQAEAVSAAMSDLAKARHIKNAQERNAAIIQAEEALRTAQLAITTSRLEQAGAIERAHVDKQVAAHLAAIERMRAAITTKTDAMGASFSKLGDFIGRAFGAKTQAMLDAVSAKFDKQIASVQKWQSELTDAEKALRAFDSAGSGGPTASESQLSALDASEAERSRQMALTAAQAEMAKAQAITDVQEKAAAVAAAEEQLRQANLAITRAGLEAQAAVERTARDAAIAEQRASLEQAANDSRVIRDQEAADKIASLEASKKAELDNLTETRRQQEEQMNAKLAELQAQLAKHPGQWKKINGQIITLLKGYGVDLKNSGELLGKAFADGLDKAADDVRKSAKGLAEIVAKYLKLNSPAEAGPLSGIGSWFKPIGPMLAKQMNARVIAAAASRMAGAAIPAAALRPMGLAGGAGTASSFGAGAAGGNTVNVYVTSYGAEDGYVRDIARKIRTELQRNGARNG